MAGAIDNFAAEFLSSFAHGGGQHVEHLLRVFPANAGVGNGDAVLEAGFAFGRNFLIA